MNENLGASYSVVKIDTSNNNDIVFLYEFIPNLKDAELLAQLAMCSKCPYELIHITPGWNKSINKEKRYLEEYNKALDLAKEYEAEDCIPF